MADDQVLRVSNLTVAFGGNQVLNGIDFEARPGFSGLIGPNGAGKTTLFNVITGYVQPRQGEVRLGNELLTGRGPASVAASGVARTFQTPKLIQDMSVLENILLGVDGHRRLRDWGALLGSPRSERALRRRATELLADFSLQGLAHDPVSSLSLGSQKLVEVVRALLSQPRLLLLDEPAAGVSASDVRRMTEPLEEIAKTEDLCMVIIEHDLELVSTLCQDVTVLDFGRVLATGHPHEVIRRPDVVAAYLGASFAAERT